MDADVTDSAGPPSDPDRPEATEGGGQQDGTPQDGTPENGSPESGSPQDSPSQSGPPQDSPPQGDASQQEGSAAAEADTADGAGASGPEAEVGEAGEVGAAASGEAEGGPESEAGPVRGEADGVQTWADQPKDGILAARRSHWLRWTALAASFLVLIAAGVGWWMYKKLDGNITTDTSAAAELKAYEKERPTPVVMDAQNILLIGSDSRAGDNRKYGRDDGGSQRSDTTILLHLAADRKSATAVSIPRDLMVEIPSCRTADDKKTRERFTQFNSAFELGGTACTIRTVERMTGIRVDHHMVVDFNGFKDMVDAVDGVEICLKEPIDDKDAKLELPAGRQTLNGEEALGYVRARKSLGNGSDTERMERQQQFLGALVNKMQSNGVLLNPTRLYPVLDAATKSLTTDPGLDSLRDLYDLVRGMRDVPTEQVQFLTVPRQPYRNDPNRDELVEPDAGDLFKQLREDKPVAVVPADELEEAERDQESGRDGKPDDAASESPTPTPTYSGSSAADDLCKQ
ncbi:LCP family protein [Streptomyces parvus]|uniref:LCP family protein n=1 Tax=Streptomyces parvus TaxID=66428 RepID=UPI0035DC5B3A